MCKVISYKNRKIITYIKITFQVKKHGIFGHKRSKSDAEADDFLCPIDFGNGRMVNGRMDPEVTIIEELI